MRFFEHARIGKIPRDKVVTYAIIMVEYCAHKKDPNCVRIPAGDTLLKGTYPGKLFIHASDLPQTTCV